MEHQSSSGTSNGLLHLALPEDDDEAVRQDVCGLFSGRVLRTPLFLCFVPRRMKLVLLLSENSLTPRRTHIMTKLAIEELMLSLVVPKQKHEPPMLPDGSRCK